MKTAEQTIEGKVTFCGCCERFKGYNGEYVRVPTELMDFYFKNCKVDFTYCRDCEELYKHNFRRMVGR